MRFSLYFPILLLVVLISSCNSSPLDVDVRGVELNYRSERFDRDFFKTHQNDGEHADQVLYQKYGQFYVDYLEFILRLGPFGERSTAEMCQSFLSDEAILDAYDQIQLVHDPLISDYDKGFQDAFRHHKYYFPKETIPEVVYYHSGFNFGIYPTDSLLAVGLEFYLGPNNELVQQLPGDVFPQYFREKMRPDYLVSDAVRGWLLVKHQHTFDDSNLLGHLIYYGKVMYLVDAMMPDVEDSIKMNYRSDQMAWVIKNEPLIWRELAQQTVMFDTRVFEINKWLMDGPFTNAQNVPQDSPPRLGIWMGRQIIHDYMAANPDLTLDDLLSEENNQLILKFYDPRH
jgi:hypothetical protein